MAYMNQENKKKIAAALKLVVPKDWKYSLGVDNHSSIVMNVKSAPVDILGMLSANSEYPIATHVQLSQYWLEDHLKGAPDSVLQTLKNIFAALNDGNHDRSDVTTDYFDVGWYIELNFGKWDKPFVNTAAV